MRTRVNCSLCYDEINLPLFERSNTTKNFSKKEGRFFILLTNQNLIKLGF